MSLESADTAVGPKLPPRWFWESAVNSGQRLRQVELLRSENILEILVQGLR